MSGLVTGWVLKNSPVDGAARMVLVILADHASSDGSRAYPAASRAALAADELMDLGIDVEELDG